VEFEIFVVFVEEATVDEVFVGLTKEAIIVLKNGILLGPWWMKIN